MRIMLANLLYVPEVLPIFFHDKFQYKNGQHFLNIQYYFLVNAFMFKTFFNEHGNNGWLQSLSIAHLYSLCCISGIGTQRQTCVLPSSCGSLFFNTIYTVCPRSSDPFYIVRYYILWVTTSWTCSTRVPRYKPGFQLLPYL